MPLEEPEAFRFEFIGRAFVENNEFVFRRVAKPLVDSHVDAFISPAVAATDQDSMGGKAFAQFGEAFSRHSNAVALFLYDRTSKKAWLRLKQAQPVPIFVSAVIRICFYFGKLIDILLRAEQVPIDRAVKLEETNLCSWF